MDTQNGLLSYQISVINDKQNGTESATDEAAVALATKTAHIYRKQTSHEAILKMHPLSSVLETPFTSLDKLILTISYKDAFFGVVLFIGRNGKWSQSLGLYTHDADNGYVVITKNGHESGYATLDPEVKRVFEAIDCDSYILVTFERIAPVQVKLEKIVPVQVNLEKKIEQVQLEKKMDHVKEQNADQSQSSAEQSIVVNTPIRISTEKGDRTSIQVPSPEKSDPAPSPIDPAPAPQEKKRPPVTKLAIKTPKKKIKKVAEETETAK